MEVEKRANGFDFPERNTAKSVNGRQHESEHHAESSLSLTHTHTRTRARARTRTHSMAALVCNYQLHHCPYLA
ncbi:hypothetical protein KUCAC02_028806 [Chaenocephalus aceratus]|uniref:Uncharacterized protein n=1 Tax=Chaenocephalus aceratus TaxID=36190 RepID=A0ACB9X3T9_CHAAC|nr:hypothetical protein KUCAC02_028806 [Chaenocephalus aceratus]